MKRVQISCKNHFSGVRFHRIASRILLASEQKRGWRIVNQCGQERLSQNSVRVEILMTSFMNFSALKFRWSWIVSGEWYWLRTLITSVLIKESESIWSFNLWDKCLNKWTWKRWKLVLLKNVLSQWCGISFRAWRALLRRNRSAAIWNFLLELGDLAVWLRLAGDKVYITMRQTRRCMSQHKMSVRRNFLMKIRIFFENFCS